jgi:DNA-binding transcriptional MerR regulator
VALRDFGFTLAEIGGLLDDAGPDPRELVRSQLDQANERIARASRLRDRLAAVLRMYDAAGSPSADVLVRLIEEMTIVNAEEFEKMAEQRRAMTAKLSPQELAEMAARRQAAWDKLTVEQQVELIRSRPPVPH